MEELQTKVEEQGQKVLAQVLGGENLGRVFRREPRRFVRWNDDEEGGGVRGRRSWWRGGGAARWSGDGGGWDTEGSVGQARPSVVEEARRAAGQDGVGKVR